MSKTIDDNENLDSPTNHATLNQGYSYVVSNRPADATTTNRKHERPKTSIALNERSPSTASANGEPQPKAHQQLRMLPAAMLICGEVAGVGILSMPSALASTGWVGIVLLVGIGIASCYTGVLLARCWMILQTNYPEYAEHCRFPYPSIAYQALGRPGRVICSILINATLLGASIVFTVLAAQNTQAIIMGIWGVDRSLCMYIIIWGFIYMPITWLGSPKDFWQLGVGAWVATAIVIVLVIIGVFIDHENNPHDRAPPAVTFQTFFFGFGTFMFAYAVHPSLPTIQHDMRRASDFQKSVIIAFAVTTVQYLPMPIICYSLYGKVSSNILRTLPKGGLQYASIILITCHLLLAINVVLNTVYQEFEHLINLKHGFNIQRIAMRSCTLLFVIFVALSIPHFGVLLDLVGGLCVTALTFIFPPMCYYVLKRKWSVIPIPIYEKVIMALLVVLGLIGAVVASYSGIYELITSPTFTAPCYTAAWNDYTFNNTQ